MFIFPGVGLGAVVANVPYVTDRMFYEAALSLSRFVSEDHLAQGQVYPSIRDIRQVSLTVAAAVARTAQQEGLTRKKRDEW